MAWQLSHELTHTGVQLTGAQFKVLAVIAEECRDPDTRTCVLDRDVLAKRAKLSKDGVKRALLSLKKRGLDPRVPIPGLYGTDGEPVFAFPGRPCTYRMPRLIDEPDPKPDDDEPEGGGKRTPKGGGKRTPRGRRKPRGAGADAAPPTRAEVGAARAAAIADCDQCDEFGYVPGPDGVGVANHHPRAAVETAIRQDGKTSTRQDGRTARRLAV